MNTPHSNSILNALRNSINQVDYLSIDTYEALNAVRNNPRQRDQLHKAYSLTDRADQIAEAQTANFLPFMEGQSPDWLPDGLQLLSTLNKKVGSLHKSVALVANTM